MKKAFVGLMVAVLMTVGAPLAFASNIPMPNLPIGETAYKIQKFQETCGEAIFYSYHQNGFWVVVTLNGNWFAVLSYESKPFPQKAWLIRNLDGHIDEYFDDAWGVFIKYSTICDAVK